MEDGGKAEAAAGSYCVNHSKVRLEVGTNMPEKKLKKIGPVPYISIAEPSSLSSFSPLMYRGDV